MNWIKDRFLISDDHAKIDVETVYQLLSKTYWASDRTRETIERSINNSISFGLYDNGMQIGFARVITDKAVLSYLLDVVIDENYQGNGLGCWLMECILVHPDIKNTRFILGTKDAHDFYKKFQFKEKQCMHRGLIVE